MNAKYYVIEKLNGSFVVRVASATMFGLYKAQGAGRHVIYTDNIDVSLECINARGEV